MENCTVFFKTQAEPEAALTLTVVFMSIYFKVSPKIARVLRE